MTRTSPTTIAVAADYADAMLVARRAKNFLALLLALILLGQMGVFFAARYGHLPFHPADLSATTGNPYRAVMFLEFFTDVALYGGIVLPIVLSIVLLLVVTIMLVGRLVGVSHVTSAFCWSVVLIVFMFPWQSFLNSHLIQASMDLGTGNGASTQPSVIHAVPDIRPPGALYTWPELLRDYKFPEGFTMETSFKWLRYAGYPFAMLLLLFVVNTRSSRGLRFALGEAELHVEVAVTPPV